MSEQIRYTAHIVDNPRLLTAQLLLNSLYRRMAEGTMNSPRGMAMGASMPEGMRKIRYGGKKKKMKMESVIGTSRGLRSVEKKRRKI
jgi:hypothetical protein